MKSIYSENFRLGILGGGQLGRMFIQEAVNYDARIAILDPSHDAPCATLCHEFVCGSFQDFDTVVAFGKDKDVLTVEIEHVNVDALTVLEQQGVQVYPRPSFLRMVQDKGLQKEFYTAQNIPTAPYRLIENLGEIDAASQRFPFVLKSRTGGYDGKGVQIIRTADDLSNSFAGPCVAEEMIDFSKELSIIIARNQQGEMRTFPLVEMEFNPEANLVEFLFSPAQVSSSIEAQAQTIARTIVESSDFVGLLAIEIFLTKDGHLLVNEMAPRPHNSGHHTIEACTTSQYEQHLRAIASLPLGDTRLIEPAVMVNLLGEAGHDGPVKYQGLEEALALPGVHVHLYGKARTKPFRKMGHITVTAPDLTTAQQRAREVLRLVKVLSC
ncbi:MAG: 5-(carboxyamino)imidazole ribonucleotide synthase [Flavobacteriales bacterium]